MFLSGQPLGLGCVPKKRSNGSYGDEYRFESELLVYSSRLTGNRMSIKWKDNIKSSHLACRLSEH